MRHLLAIAAFGAAVVPCAARADALPPIHVGSIYATKVGDGPVPLVLLPGLGCGPWEWQGFVGTLPAHAYTVYEVTPAGFDRTPPIAGPNRFQAYADSVRQLITDRKLDRPVLIGHSMGGELALHVASSLPELRGVVIVDSFPMYPPLGPGETLEARKAQWTALVARTEKQSDADYAAFERQGVSRMVTDPATAADAVNHVLTSDRTAVVESAYDIATTDLHPDLARLSVPTIVLGETGAGFPVDATRQFYQQQYADAKAVTVKIIPNSRHFIMLDQPKAFADAVNGFLTSLR